jgi:hypothetical protein
MKARPRVIKLSNPKVSKLSDPLKALQHGSEDDIAEWQRES